tara:strand:- start:145 stop:678 length:534 start_codon:yes stop_codon:yes gene_type:complete
MEDAIKEAAATIAGAISHTGGLNVLRIVQVFLFGCIAFGTFFIAFINHRNDKRRRTLDLVKGLITDADVLARMGRVYSYRRQNTGFSDPYNNRADISYEHDLICILNYFESLCLEIKEGLVYKKIIREHSSDLILGIGPLLDELANLLGHSVNEKFPALVETISEWQPTPKSSSATN